MTTEEKKIGIIGKIVNLENKKLIDQVDELLKGELVDLKTRTPGWGKNMVNEISDDFDDFVPPGFPIQ
jgi:ACT domain-containing protein